MTWLSEEKLQQTAEHIAGLVDGTIDGHVCTRPEAVAAIVLWIRAAVDIQVRFEREACAGIAEDMSGISGHHLIADAIRARGDE